MEGKRTKSRALLVFGAPCSGKTTFAVKFAEKYDLAFYNLDEIMDKDNFSRETMLEVLKLITKTHKNLIIEGGLNTEDERREVRNMFYEVGYEPSLFWVQTDIITIRKRMKFQYKSVSKAREIYDNAIAGMEAPSEAENPIILSGKHTFETQSRHALAGLADVGKR